MPLMGLPDSDLEEEVVATTPLVAGGVEVASAPPGWGREPDRPMVSPRCSRSLGAREAVEPRLSKALQPVEEEGVVARS